MVFKIIYSDGIIRWFLRWYFKIIFQADNSSRYFKLIFQDCIKMCLFGVFLSLLFSQCNVYNNIFWIHVPVISTSDSHGKHISYSNGVPPAKHVWSYGRAGRIDPVSIKFHTPCLLPNDGNFWFTTLLYKTGK